MNTHTNDTRLQTRPEALKASQTGIAPTPFSPGVLSQAEIRRLVMETIG